MDALLGVVLAGGFEAVRVACAVAGVVIILLTAANVLKALVMPGGQVSRLVKAVDQGTDRLFRPVSRRVSDVRVRHRILSFHAPLILATLLGAWLMLFLLGFALLLWPLTHNLGHAFREAGSSLFTLGFASTGGTRTTAVDFLAAATGLIVVALQIAYLPALYGAFNRRETEVTLVGVRAGLPAWGPELLSRTRFFTSEPELPDFYKQWERWAAEVAESHSSYPVLLRFRSPEPLSSWLVALLAVMDSAALFAALAPKRVPVEARLCLRMGFGCLRSLALTIGIPYEEDPRPDAGIALSREEFDQGIARLQRVAFPMERTPDEAWPHFQGWRVNYESIAYRIAYQIDAVPAAWSGPRRDGGATMTPTRTVNRTPEDPEGATPPPPPRRR